MKVPKQLEHGKVVVFLPTDLQRRVNRSVCSRLGGVEGEQGRILCKHVGNEDSPSVSDGEFKAAFGRSKRVELMKSLLDTLLP